MGKVKSKKPPWRRRLSLKGALISTTLVCVFVAIIACLLEIYVLSTVHRDIYETYVEPYTEAHKVYYDDPDTDKAYLLVQDYSSYYDPDTGDRIADNPLALIPAGYFQFVYRHTDIIAILLCFCTAILAFLADALWFYRWKIKKPLSVLQEASEKIAGNDLDFTITPPSADELGKLCGSFEKMRGSLEENNRALWKAMEERRRLNAAFAHDLRTPLTVLQGYSDFLLEGLPAGEIKPQKAEETVSTMKRSLTRLQRYVEGMSDLQNLEDLQPAKKPVEFQVLADQLRETAEILRGPEGCTFTAQGSGTLTLDSELVFQVFENLMSNAGRYAKKKVAVRVKAEETALVLFVADDGPGFPPEALKRAAEPYYRADKSDDSASQKAGGQHFGLGLYICRLLCEKHGGSLVLSNRSQGGAEIMGLFEAGN